MTVKTVDIKEKSSKSEIKKQQVKVPIITQIQNELKVPKGHYNDYGQFWYRSVEDIEFAIKPILKKYGATLTINEEVKEIGGRVYFVETVRYKDSEQEIEVKGYAREPESKKKMDDAQISGASSSYATKYALGKLFLIDDTADADSSDQFKAIEGWDLQKLQTYPIEFKNTPTNIGILMSYYKKDNQSAIDCVNGLKGEAKKVFEVLLDRE